MSCQASLQAMPQGSCRFETNSKVVEEKKHTPKIKNKKKIKKHPKKPTKTTVKVGQQHPEG